MDPVVVVELGNIEKFLENVKEEAPDAANTVLVVVLLQVTVALLPTAAALPTRRVPVSMYKTLNVLSPVRISVPVPRLVKVFAPVSTELMVFVLALLTVVV
jgi:hypothetical protein